MRDDDIFWKVKAGVSPQMEDSPASPMWQRSLATSKAVLGRKKWVCHGAPKFPMGLSYFSPFRFYHMRVYRCRKAIVKEILSRPIPIRCRAELMQPVSPGLQGRARQHALPCAKAHLESPVADLEVWMTSSNKSENHKAWQSWPRFLRMDTTKI